MRRGSGGGGGGFFFWGGGGGDLAAVSMQFTAVPTGNYSRNAI